MDGKTCNLDQVIRAKRELRDAAGAPDAEYSIDDVIGMLSDEILLLRERGFSNQRIADMLSGFDISASESDLVEFFRDVVGSDTF